MVTGWVFSHSECNNAVDGGSDWVCIFAEKLTFRKWAGMLLGIVGIIAIATIGEPLSVEKQIAGVIACLIATSCYAIAGFLTRSWIIWSTHSGPTVNWLQQEAWISVIAAGAICTAFAYILYFRLIADIGPLRSLTVTFLIPPFAVLWGYLALGETINQGFIIGALIVCVSVWLAVSPEKASTVLKSEATK